MLKDVIISCKIMESARDTTDAALMDAIAKSIKREKSTAVSINGIDGQPSASN